MDEIEIHEWAIAWIETLDIDTVVSYFTFVLFSSVT